MRLTGCWLRNRKLGFESCLRSLWAIFRLEAFITASFDKERTFRGFYGKVDNLEWRGIVKWVRYGLREIASTATELRLEPGRYVATEIWLELGCYVATERSLELGRYIATELSARVLFLTQSFS
ncbi:hypothetical protein F2Q69_00055848 [Brassica cretica]|uniref:Uncharacterized protein n=1 Tax=Brassica cretica TaxID=69181 RepID=A0A8S9MZW6_BRACR|nr:hypothetical protein F2Q69_00055848 [Brassica cretica]